MTTVPVANRNRRVPPRPMCIGPVVVDPPVLQAPMAGVTNYAFRQIVREFGGAGLLTTEMVHARSFDWMDQHGGRQPERLWGVKDEPRPLAVQIWDNDPAVLADVGARLAHDYGVSVVDINFGCPARPVTRRAGSGAYLLGYPDRVGAIVARVVTACHPTPVTAKIRLGRGRDSVNAVVVARVVEQAGAAALTVHGRTARDGFQGTADWAQIARIKPFLKRMALVGNGDLDSAAKVVDVFRRYAVDGVMIGRAALRRPWLFRQVAAALRGEPPLADPTPTAQQRLLLYHFGLLCRRFGDRKGTLLMRRYACCYAHGQRGAREFRRHVTGATTATELVEVVRRLFPAGPSAAVH